MPTAQPFLQIRDLTVRFGGVTALSGVDLTLDRGGFRAVIGPNGAGNTTLFNVIVGMIRPTSGQVLLSGAAVRRAPPATMRHRDLARTFQVARVFGLLNVAENVAIAAAGRRLLHPLGALRRFRADGDLIDTVGQLLANTSLYGRAGERADSLNTGDVRRLDIARTLAGDPALLLLGEHAAGIGVDGMRSLGELIASLRGRGVSVRLVEHYVGWALSLVDRAVVLDMGAGQSCLLKCVIGLVPGRGTMTFSGRDLLSEPAYRRAAGGIGYVPEGRRIFVGLTVEGNPKVT